MNEAETRAERIKAADEFHLSICEGQLIIGCVRFDGAKEKH